MCLTETRVTSDIEDFELALDNYAIERVNSESRHTGGVILYIRKDILFQNVYKHVIVKNLWFLVVSLRFSNTKYMIVCLYHSPNESHTVFLDFFENWLDQNILNVECTLIILGDFNIHWNGTNQYANRLKKCLNDFSLKQVVDAPTHTYQNGSSIIDLVVTNNYDLKTTVMDQPNITDHSIVKIEISLALFHPLKRIIVRNKYFDRNYFVHKLKNIFIDYRIRDINVRYNMFYDSVLKVINEVIPKRQITVKSNNKEWFNESFGCN